MFVTSYMYHKPVREIGVIYHLSYRLGAPLYRIVGEHQPIINQS